MEDIITDMVAELEKTKEGKEVLLWLKTDNSIIQIQKMMLQGEVLLGNVKESSHINYLSIPELTNIEINFFEASGSLPSS